MKKIGRISAFLIFVWLFLSGSVLNAVAQSNFSVQATVSDATVYTGNRIRLNITVSGDFEDISLPDLPSINGLTLLSPTPSTSRRYSYVNGVSKTSYTYSYYLLAKKAGTYTIPSVSIQINNKNYKTDPITVTVNDRGSTTKDDDRSTGADIFLKMEVSDQTVVPGEQITASIVLYFKNNIQVRTYQPIPGWKAKGFWKEKLKKSGRPQVKSAVINGVRYHKARLLQFALFPTKSGELTISPYRVDVVVYSRSSRRDPFSFFGSSSSNRRKLELKTDPIAIEVKPLPDANNNYIGAVGSFTIKRKIDADTVKVGESIEIKTVIAGTGNIPLLTKPEYNFPNNLEVYQPQSDVKIKRSGGSIGGRKAFTDVLVPRNPGSVTISSDTISWYNPSKGKYVQKKLAGKTIYVKPGKNLSNSNNNSSSIITPITGLVNWTTSRKPVLIHYWWFWIGIILPIVGLAVGYWKKTYNLKMNKNYNFARAQRASAKANERLEQAIKQAENNQIQEAYNSLQKALTGFIGDKLGMPEAGISIEQYIEALEEHQVQPELKKNVRILLNKSATVNYAPDISTKHLKSHVQLAKSIIKKLKKEL